jgi:hypothetical protein
MCVARHESGEDRGRPDWPTPSRVRRSLRHELANEGNEVVPGCWRPCESLVTPETSEAIRDAVSSSRDGYCGFAGSLRSLRPPVPSL